MRYFILTIAAMALVIPQAQGFNRSDLKKLFSTRACVKCDLKNARPAGSDLSGMNLRGAILREAELKGVNLSGANLEKADLRRANLEKSNLNEAKLQAHCSPMWISTNRLFGMSICQEPICATPIWNM